MGTLDDGVLPIAANMGSAQGSIPMERCCEIGAFSPFDDKDDREGRKMKKVDVDIRAWQCSTNVKHSATGLL